MGNETSDRLVVVSPHLDDAALSCSELIAAHPGTVVVTVFAGAPATLTHWDRAECGFTDGDDVKAIRREEDRNAMQLLGATPDWLDLVPGAVIESAALASTISEAVARHRPTKVAIPLGVHHADHIRIADACRLAFDCESTTVLVYEDQPYRGRHEEEREERLYIIREEGFKHTPVPVPRAVDKKRAAIHCYKSQVGAIDRCFDAFTRRLERDGRDVVWRLQRA